MGFFSSILDKLRHHSAPAGTAPGQQGQASAQTQGQAPIQNVDVDRKSVV